MWILKLGWRNLFRNRRRTFLTAAIIALGLASLIYFDAIFLGMIDNMVANATGTFLGQAQIHAQGFRAEEKVERVIQNLPQVRNKLGRDSRVAAWTERALSMAMVTSTTDAESILLYGIDPKGEEGISRVREAVREGQNLSGPDDSRVMLGARLAKTLGVVVGDKVVLTCARAQDGELSQELFRVGGVFSFDSPEMDRSIAFVGLEKARRMLGLEGATHEIALSFRQGDGSEPSLKSFYERFSADGNEALDWGRLMPDLKSAIDLSSFASLFMAVLLGGVVALAILNTLFMALYERMFEFGVLRALGTRPARLALLVLVEAASLGLLSVVGGIILAALVTALFAWIGLDYSGMEFAGVTFRKAIYPQARLLQYTLVPLGVWFFTMLIALYPAWVASRLVPAKALHRSLG